MPHQTETRNIINQSITAPERSGANSLVLSRPVDKYVSDSNFAMVHTKIVLGSDLVLVSDADNAAKAGGAQIFSFPDGYVTIHNARIAGSIGSSVQDMTSNAGEIGLGTAAASGASATIGGSASFENILQGGRPAMSNMSAATDLAVTAGGTTRTSSIGNFSSAASCFLNIASTWGNVASPGNIIARTGMEIDILWSIAEA